jgi:hypothetical protein
MDTESPLRPRNSTASSPPAPNEQIRESAGRHVEPDVAQCGLSSNVYYANLTPVQGNDQPSDRLHDAPALQKSSNDPIVWLSDGERWDGLIGTYSHLGMEEDGLFYEVGGVYERYEDQEGVPFVPSSFANLDLARLTAWGYVLFFVTLFAIVLPAIGVAQVLGVEQLSHSLRMPAAILGLALWGVLFLVGRVFLETKNITVLRRKKTGNDKT